MNTGFGGNGRRGAWIYNLQNRKKCPVNELKNWTKKQNIWQINTVETQSIKIMTPKEKAEKIYSEMLYHIEWDFGSDNKHSKGVAKACTCNAIKEAINALNSESNIDDEIQFLQDALKEVQLI